MPKDVKVSVVIPVLPLVMVRESGLAVTVYPGATIGTESVADVAAPKFLSPKYCAERGAVCGALKVYPLSVAWPPLMVTGDPIAPLPL